MKILDGCCGIGGISKGLADAGHEVTGVDSNPRLREDYLRSGAAEFICADILDVLADTSFMARFDAAATSPPCFPAGTPVVTARGVLPIEDVHLGDQVLTHLGRWRHVIGAMNRQADVYADGWLASTADHPFWAREQVRARTLGRQGAGGGHKGTDQDAPCEICGKPTSSSYNVCGRTLRCRNERSYRVKRKTQQDPGRERVHGTHKGTNQDVPCEICGRPTSSKYGVCQKTAACRQELGSRAQQWSLSDPAWTPANQLHGRFIAMPAVASPLPVPLISGYTAGFSWEFWWMVGRWVGDGWLRLSGTPRGSNEVIICCAASEADDLKSKLTSTDLHWTCSQERTTVRFRTAHTGLARWLTDNFGQGAAGKTLPGWMLGIDPAIRQMFLDGYISADGCKIDGGHGITTVSTGLAFGIRVLATTLGYTTSTSLAKVSPTKVIEGRTVNQRPWWRVDIRQADNRYTRSYGLHRWVKRRRPMVFRSRETVYDLTVEEDHSFIAWGFAVHNCQSASTMSNCRPGLAATYPNLIPEIRPLLQAWGGPFTIENVSGMRPWMIRPVTLCMWNHFGRELYRHRLIEAGGGLALQLPETPDRLAHACNDSQNGHGQPVRINPECGLPHPFRTARAGHWTPGYFVSVAGHERKEPVRRVMEIPWARNRDDVKEAVPPYVGAWLAEQFEVFLTGKAAA